MAKEAGDGEPLLGTRKSSYTRCMSHAGDELRSFRSCLRWMCVDQSDACHAAISWSLFLTLAVFVPAASHFLLYRSAAATPSHRTYDAVVQLSLTAASVLGYLCLSAFVRRYGLRRFLFLDKLVGESERVRLGYTVQLSRSFRLLAIFVMPCFAAECAHRIWRYIIGAGPGEGTTFLWSVVATDVVCCSLELASWIYRTAIFFLVCVLFRLGCHLQILRLQDFAAVFGVESDVAAVLREHMRIRRQLKVISHRYRLFIISTLILVTASQFASLLLTTRPHAGVTLLSAGELALNSISLVTGLSICLRTAAKITHKAQAITCHAAAWHAYATIDSFDEEDPETPSSARSHHHQHHHHLHHPAFPFANDARAETEDDDFDGDEDDLDDPKLLPHQVHTISFQKRQALVTYLEHNKAGITVFGFTVDRSWLHTVFMIELSLVLWLLGKTIGIS